MVSGLYGGRNKIMWSYYGAKTNVVKRYPPPKYGKVIEPFAGTARYALEYYDREVIILDKYEVVVKIWQWLQMCSPKDILKLPNMKQGERVDQFNFDCVEAKWLMGFIIGFMTESPRTTATIRLTQRPNAVNYTLNRIANNLFKIKNWDIRLGTYDDLENVEATWFVDPPYQYGGHLYKHNNKSIDFSYLSDWCRSRKGQVIVCETIKADWMDFKPMTTHKTRQGFQKEAIWSNEPTAFDHEQLKLYA